ncbi:MAG: hypothetical protein GEU77_04565 [Deltaproteobacteria bacterium]|nr:hypothetical protein [Deltaproteobacteria bacterium]
MSNDPKLAEKVWLQAAQKDLRGKACENPTSGSEAIERNEAYEAFSAACENAARIDNGLLQKSF